MGWTCGETERKPNLRGKVEGERSRGRQWLNYRVYKRMDRTDLERDVERAKAPRGLEKVCQPCCLHTQTGVT